MNQAIGSAVDDNKAYDYESAIQSVSEAAKDADGLTLLMLQKHLQDLCAAHLAYLKGGQHAFMQRIDASRN